MSDCQQIDELLSGYIDGELTQGSRQRVELHIGACGKCRQAYEELVRLQQNVGEMSFDQLSESEWSTIMNDLTVRSSRGTGWLLFIVGLVVVIVYGSYQFAVDDTVPALIRSSIAAIVFGIALLFVSVFRQRLIASKTDRYRDVEI